MSLNEHIKAVVFKYIKKNYKESMAIDLKGKLAMTWGNIKH